MAKNIKVSEPDENFIRYPRMEVDEGEDIDGGESIDEGEGIEEKTEMPETEINRKKQWRENLFVFGFLFVGYTISLGVPIGINSLSARHDKKPFRDNSYKVSPLGWEIKSVVGERYVGLRNDGTLETYRPSFGWLDKQVELVDSNLDGLVDVIKFFANHGCKEKLVREQTGNTPMFEKADQKYRQYREQLADLIAKAEKEWSEQ